MNHDAFNTTIPKLEKVTDKYQFLPTVQIVEDMRALGFEVTGTQAPRKGLGLHLVKFAHKDLPEVAGGRLEAYVYNSHDATAALKILIGAFVFACSNGLVIGRLDQSERIVHKGYAKEKLKAAIEAAFQSVQARMGTIKALQNTQVDTGSLQRFLFEAQTLRDALPFRLEALADVRHRDQRQDTAWNVFNRVQEALIQGGYRTYDAECPPRAGRRAKAVTNVREQLRINTSLWDLATSTLLK